MTPATTTRRPTLPTNFIEANTRRRILTGTATAIARHGYKGAKIADIVQVCRCARKTFYDCYGGKEEAALAMLTDTYPGLDVPEQQSMKVLAIEVAALHSAGDAAQARDLVRECDRAVRSLARLDLTPLPPPTDPRQQSLPPGRHGLPAEFLRANQRARLLSGLASSLVVCGYPGTTIQSVCRLATVSRRTFYEHFPALDKASLELAKDAGAAEVFVDIDPATSVGAVVSEVLGERVLGGENVISEVAVKLLEKLEINLEGTDG